MQAKVHYLKYLSDLRLYGGRVLKSTLLVSVFFFSLHSVGLLTQKNLFTTNCTFSCIYAKDCLFILFKHYYYCKLRFYCSINYLFI